MDSQKLNDWLQVVGAGGIIASLVFVGIQLKQTQEIAIAAQYQARHESVVETLRSQLQSDAALKLYGKRLAEDLQRRPGIPPPLMAWINEQPVEELAVISLGAQINLKTYDNLYFQYQSGFLSEEAWLAFLKELKFALSQNPPMSVLRDIYFDTRDIQRESYRDLIDGLIAEVEAESGE